MQTSQEYFEFQTRIFAEMAELTRAKNADYAGGTDNPFANFDEAAGFGVDPLVGLCVRMGDKMQRLKAFCKTGTLQVQTKGDTVADIFRDFIGYSVLALGMLERNKS